MGMEVGVMDVDDELGKDDMFSTSYEVNYKYLFWGKDDDPGEYRWIPLPKSIKTEAEATAWAHDWIAKQNKIVNGCYKFCEINMDYAGGPIFKIHFLVATRNVRWIRFQDQNSVNEINAEEKAMEWVDRQNKMVFGTYTYLEHNLGKVEKGFAGFKVHFKPPAQKPFKVVLEDEWVCLDESV